MPDAAETTSKDSVSELNRHLFTRFIEDQSDIWSSPFSVKQDDWTWLVPIAGVTAGLILTDRDSQFEMSRTRVSSANRFSNIGLAAFGAGVGSMYLLGRSKGSPRLQETGFLAVEAGINSLAVGEVLKFAFQRDRPEQGDGSGHFFRSGGKSFYSVHSTVAWSFASVIAHQYPGWLSKALAYGSASAISLSRVAADQHFPSDVFVGAVTGYLIGKRIYKKHHNPDIDVVYGRFVKEHPEWSSRSAGTTYVPIDSWVYPAMEKLIAAGYVRYQFMGLRPWTRTAISDMLDEAEGRMLSERNIPSHLKATYEALRSEFADEGQLGAEFDNQAIQLESLYTRSTAISGPPLNDSYHFGQTLINDFGRPYQRGFNQIAGFTARAEQGRFAYYVRGEYQHAPSAPALSLLARQVIAAADNTPLQPAVPFEETNRFRLLDAYASTTVLGNVVSVGKQSMFWGPNTGGAMIMSNNATPFYMIRIDRAVPFRLPWIFKYLGPFRYDAYLGKLEGHQFPPRPFMHGEKVSLKPTENLEFGFSRTAVFAGQGVSPLTFGVFWKSLTSTISSTTPGADPRVSPGARHGQFDFSYRVPWLRKWITIYSDSIVHDDISPIDAPRRAAWNPGIHLSHFPKLPKLDLRVEAVNTDPPITNSNGGKFFYYQGVYRDGYLNDGDLMGSWVGREGKGIQAWSTYWISPQSTIQFGFRNMKVAKDFIPDGETSNSFSLKAKLRLKPDVEFSSFLQYERWKAPVLAPGLQTNFTAAFQLTFWPKDWKAASR